VVFRAHEGIIGCFFEEYVNGAMKPFCKSSYSQVNSELTILPLTLGARKPLNRDEIDEALVGYKLTRMEISKIDSGSDEGFLNIFCST
jgi:hypothetical protein